MDKVPHFGKTLMGETIRIVDLEGKERHYRKAYEKQENKWIKAICGLAGMYLAFTGAAIWFMIRIILSYIMEEPISNLSIQMAFMAPLFILAFWFCYTGMYVCAFYSIYKPKAYWQEITKTN